MANVNPKDFDALAAADGSEKLPAYSSGWKNVTLNVIKTWLSSYFAAALGTDDNYVTDAEKSAIGTISDKLDANGGTLVNYSETLKSATLTENKTITLSEGTVQRFYINPEGASIQFTLPSDPGAVGKSFVLMVKNNTEKGHTWNTSPVIKWLASGGAAPDPADAGYVTVYTFVWDDADGGTGRWLGFLAGKETA